MIDDVPALRDSEVEAAVVGAILLRASDPDFAVFLADVCESVGETDFHNPKTRAVFAAEMRLYAAGEPLELLRVKGELQNAGALDMVGGVDFLHEVVSGTPSNGITGLDHAKRVRDLSRLRDLVWTVRRIELDTIENPSDADYMIEAAEERIFLISRQNERTRSQSVGDGLDSLVDRLEAGEPAAVGLDTSLPSLDAIVGGLMPGAVYVIGAPPSAGKSALAGQIAQHVAMNRKRGVLYVSLEMAAVELQMRAMASLSGVGLHWMKKPQELNVVAIQNMRDAADALRDAPLYLDDAFGLTAMNLRSRVRREAARHDLGLIVVDYLQLIGGERRDGNRNNEIADISRAVKVMAGELEVPVLLLSQLNRVSRQDSRRPQLHDLRDSGSIEQDADVVILMHSEDYAKRGDPNHHFTGETDLIVAKNRNGPIGVARVIFDPERCAFVDAGEGCSSERY